MNKELFYIPNILSLARMVLLIPLAYLLLFQFTEQKTLIIIIMIAMYVTDLLDGYLARKLNQVSELGKIIDPLADKAAVIVITVILFVNGLIPVWFFTVIVLRDILILAFGLYLEKTRNITKIKLGLTFFDNDFYRILLNPEKNNELNSQYYQ